MKTLDKLNQDPRVKEARREKGWNDDGYWVDLNPGFADMKFDSQYPHHTIHESTIKGVLDRMKGVMPCNCKECKAATN